MKKKCSSPQMSSWRCNNNNNNPFFSFKTLDVQFFVSGSPSWMGATREGGKRRKSGSREGGTAQTKMWVSCAASQFHPNFKILTKFPEGKVEIYYTWGGGAAVAILGFTSSLGWRKVGRLIDLPGWAKNFWTQSNMKQGKKHFKMSSRVWIPQLGLLKSFSLLVGCYLMSSLQLQKNLMSSLFPKKYLINQNGQFDLHFTAPSGSSDEQCPDFKKMLPCTCREKNRFPIGSPKRICINTT